MRKRKTLILVLVLMIVVMAMLFTACEYGKPDKLNIADMSVGERILVGFQVTLIGLGMVFLVLVLLILFINLIKYITRFLESDKVKSFKLKKKDKKTDIVQVQDNATTDDDQEVVAVIMSALIAFYDSQDIPSTSDLPFKVRSITQINK